MPNTREKLIELLDKIIFSVEVIPDENSDPVWTSEKLAFIADHLIANGVTVHSDKDINVPTNRSAERRMIMINCGQACPYNTLDGCKVKEYNAICPLTNIATPITEYRITNADRIRAMSDEELADWLARTQIANVAEVLAILKIPYEQEDGMKDEVAKECLEWLKQPTEVTGNAQ